MILYFFIKIMLTYFLMIKKKWINNLKFFNFFFDLIIFSIFFLLFFMNYIKIKETLGIFIIGSIILIIFLIYRLLNYVLIKFDYILFCVEKKERIKKFLLKPVVNKVIYYIMWSLPWNIMYWIYFWVMENGWYFRVWFSSNRDIFFWKYFKWDSRDFFFNFFNRFDNFLKKLRDLILDRYYTVIFRLLLLFHIFRKQLLLINIKKYIWIRFIIYMYLSIFYLYFIFYFHILNYFLFYFIIFLEFILIIFFTEIMAIIEKNYGIDDKFYYILKNNGIITEEFIDLKNKFLFPLFIDYRLKWEINIYIWDKTLSNSVTLNILYKYMIWVNKNTEGYFDRQMNIRSRIHRKKYIEEKSVIWDVLPRTRYVIVSLKYFGYEYYYFNYRGMDVGKEYEFINLSKNKNLFLSFYEKTYSETSLLMLLWFLRINKSFWSSWEYNNCTFELEQLKNLFRYKANVERRFTNLFFIYYCKKDKRFLNENILFSFFFNKWKYFFFDIDYIYYYKTHLLSNKKNISISDKFIGLKDYKLMFKIMGRIQLYEEESVVWNDNLCKLLNKKEIFFLNGLESIKNSDLSVEEKLSYMYFIFLKKNETEFDLCSRDEWIKKFFYNDLSNYLITEPQLLVLCEKVINDDKMWFEFSKILIIKSFWNNIKDEDNLKILYIETLFEFWGYNESFNVPVLAEFDIDKYLLKFNLNLYKK